MPDKEAELPTGMQAIVMAGGFGTRLLPLTHFKPKPMIPILGKPILEHILQLLRKNGIGKSILTLYYKPQEIKQYFGSGRDLDCEIHYVIEQKPLGTAGSSAQALGLHPTELPVLIISGDCLTDLDLREAIRFHEEKEADVTIVLKRVKNPYEYGIVITDEEGRVQKFLEKPSRSEVFSDTINTGIYLINPEIFRSVPKGREYDFSKHLFPRLLKSGKKLYGLVLDGYWADIGDLDQYRRAQFDFLHQKIDLELPGSIFTPGIRVGENVHIEDDRKLVPPLFLGNNVRIGKNVSLGPDVVLNDNVLIDKSASLAKSIVSSASFVGEGSIVSGAVIGDNTIIETGAQVHEGVVIGSECHIGRRVSISPDVLIWPSKRIANETEVHSNLIWEDESQNPSMFTREGIVGIANLRITPDFTARVGMAFGAMIGKGKNVVISRDSTSLSRLLKRSMASGLLATGVNVLDLEMLPLPILRFAIRFLGAAGGIYVRLSREHPEVVKIHFFDTEGVDLNTDGQRKIESNFNRNTFPRIKAKDVGNVSLHSDVMNNYISQALQCFRETKARKYTAVIDFSHGKSSLVLPILLEGLDCDVISLSPFSPSGSPVDFNNKTIRANVAKFTRHNADLGVVIDINADSFLLFDENGELVPDVAKHYLLLQNYLMQDKDRKVVRPIYWSGKSVPGQTGNKIEILEAPSDPAKIMAMINEISEEGWSHFEHFYLGFDALFSVCKIIELLIVSQQPLSKLVEDCQDLFLLEDKVKCPWQQMGSIFRHAAEKLPRENISLMDGVKYVTEEGWFLLLPGTDEPNIRIYAEGDKNTSAKKFLKMGKDLVTSALKVSGN
ncbi:MAG: mannose-1-phosphate guanylyltransferase / phosphomannomutase [Candidatus Kentron sp. G]|nr:MAG: mannose-1-phosphate guanylyltransferase / phosphomannomutase [Candidatus Kentron sp. G]VFM99480.1 MAG: mannose-1-phosphate guanylyltransferase / phosphomannomutase [Candidatus Kentron sp. G]VFM99737.1 MAG: mannose-1-phosphate guanylyltransferase / phosphomannomutase [Candidatus Kentron sp. G]